MAATDFIKKLKLDKATRILIVNAPEEYLKMLDGITFESNYSSQNEGFYDFLQIFSTSQSELAVWMKKLEKAGKYDCVFWISYPKGGGKIKSDIKRDDTWRMFEMIGLRPVSQIAIDETWSAIRGRPNELVGK